MNLAEALLPGIPQGKGIVAFVGAGGKTSALFRLAQDLHDGARSILVTTTTHLLDPRLEPGRPAMPFLLRPDLEAPPGGEAPPEPRPGLSFLAARAEVGPGKVKGIHPSWVPALRPAWDLVLVEADGSKRLPVKAPAPYEPVIPPGTDLVVGIIGLDCLGRPMDARTVHRPERFEAITGCRAGEAIAWRHLAALVRHPLGLFKDAPARRAVFFNKADRVSGLPSPEDLSGLGAGAALVGSLGGPPEASGILAFIPGGDPWP